MPTKADLIGSQLTSEPVHWRSLCLYVKCIKRTITGCWNMINSSRSQRRRIKSPWRSSGNPLPVNQEMLISGCEKKGKIKIGSLEWFEIWKILFFFFPEDDQWSFRFYHEHICSNIKVLQGDQWSWIIFSLVKRNTVIFCKKPYPKAKQTLEVLFVHQMININDQ